MILKLNPIHNENKFITQTWLAAQQSALASMARDTAEHMQHALSNKNLDDRTLVLAETRQALAIMENLATELEALKELAREEWTHADKRNYEENY